MVISNKNGRAVRLLSVTEVARRNGLTFLAFNRRSVSLLTPVIAKVLPAKLVIIALPDYSLGQKMGSDL